MTMIIKNNDMLRRYLPNTLREASGEPTLMEKLLPALAAAEKWLARELTGTEIMEQLSANGEGSRMYMQAAQIVACKAMADSVPMVDLVLTPNGFGVVKNANVVPASRERVDRLVNGLEQGWQGTAIVLLDDLRNEPRWRDTEAFSRWSALLMSPLSLSRVVPDKLPLTSYILRRTELEVLERMVATEFLGAEYLADLRRQWWTNTIGLADRQVVGDVLTALSQSLKKSEPQLGMLVPTVDTIRTSPADYPIWHASPIARVYSHEPFRNKKENHGYYL